MATETTSDAGDSRRSFLRGAAAAAGAAAAFGPFDALAGRTARAALVKQPFGVDYGPLFPARDQATGLELLRLPRGFEYFSYGWTGDPMSDGIATPGAHDGMAAFHSGGAVTLVRNHEQGSITAGKFADPAYDRTQTEARATSWSTPTAASSCATGRACRARSATARAGRPRGGRG